MPRLQRHESELSFHDYNLIKECLALWPDDLEIGNRVFGSLKGNSDTRFRVTIHEVDEDSINYEEVNNG